MGRLDIDPTLQHFSHPHVLKLQNFNSQIANGSATCAACKLLPSGWMYVCSSCNYYLHKACSQMPQNKKHQVDPQHNLTLLSSPVYNGGAFKCNACGDHGKGFCYHCKECEIDLHTLCAHMPPSVNINSHHHTLSLCFSPPYQKKAFQCDICKGSGSNHWLYRCELCNFDAHLNCAICNIQTKAASGIQQMPPEQQDHQLVRSRSVPPQLSAASTSLVHRVPSLTMPATHQQIWSPSISASGNLIPVVGSSSRSQPVHQMGGYYTAGVPVLPGSGQYFHQPPRTNNTMDNNLMGIFMKGVVDGVAQQAGQILLGTILGGFSFN